MLRSLIGLALIISLSFSGFCVLLAFGVFNIGQKDGAWLTKILPARQTHFWEFFGQPFGENTFSKNGSPNKSVILMKIGSGDVFGCFLVFF